MASRSDDPRFIGKGVLAGPGVVQPVQAGVRPEKEDWTIGEPHDAEGVAHRDRPTPAPPTPNYDSRSHAAWFAGFAMLVLAAAAVGSGYVTLLARRPWVGLTEQQQIVTALTDRGMRVQFGFRNFGRMPARRLNVTAGLISGPVSEEERARIPRCEAVAGGSGTVLFPGATRSGMAELPGPIDPQTVEAIVSGQRGLYLVGCMTYVDDSLGWLGYSQARRSTFCRQFIPQSAGPLGVLGTFDDCSGGNDAD